ncbi:hypothetical protein ABZ281_46345, partial [Streptomyces sp. NPDC006265]
FSDDTPVVNLRMRDIGAELERRAKWQAAHRAGEITAYRIGGTVTVDAPNGLAVTATLPTGTTLAGAAFGEAYAGSVSGWTPSTGAPLTLTLPTSGAAPAADAATVTAPATEPAPDTRVPTGVTDPVGGTTEG